MNDQRLFCVFNFRGQPAWLTWYAFKQISNAPVTLFDHWTQKTFTVGRDDEYLIFEPYGFYLMEQTA
jgi:amylosucrase